MTNIRFENPEWLLLLLLLPLLIYFYIRTYRGRQGSVQFSDTGTLRRVKSSLWTKLRHSLIVLKVLGLGCLVTAMARPQGWDQTLSVPWSHHVIALMKSAPWLPNVRVSPLSRRSCTRPV